MSEKFERMQYSLIWTATVYIQTRCNYGEMVGVNRKKSSAFVPSGKIATVGFVENQFYLTSEVEERSKSTVGLKLDAALAKILALPLVGWKLVSQSPIYVERIRLVNSHPSEEQSFELGVGSCEGNVRIPPFHAIFFDLARHAPVAEGAT